MSKSKSMPVKSGTVKTKVAPQTGSGASGKKGYLPTVNTPSPPPPKSGTKKS